MLLVDDDERTRQTLSVALRLERWNVVTAGSGHETMRVAAGAQFDLIVIDLRLGDMSGLDVIRSLGDERPPFIVISGFLSIDTAVAAMKLGAADVIEKPIDADVLVQSVLRVLGTSDARARASSPASPRSTRLMPPPRSATERWVSYVLKACDAATDMKTLESWAQEAAVSYTTLCSNCRIMRIRPLDARDFVRVLRALKRAAVHRSPAMVFLDVSDSRTVRSLSQRAGVDLESFSDDTTVAEFLERQRFVAADNHGLNVLRELVRPSLSGRGTLNTGSAVLRAPAPLA